MTSQLYFDDSLPALVKTVRSALGDAEVSQGTVLRDASGRLAFFCGRGVAEERVRHLDGRLREVLGNYAGPEQSVFPSDALGAEEMSRDPSALLLEVEGIPVRLLDRRLVGADWLRTPSKEASPPSRFVFSSLKGGVGRSTALCVAAAHLAAQGQRVLAIDLDFEAPGLGPLLLDEKTLPPFGVVDALVENGLGGLDEEFMRDLIGPSSLAGHGGRIDVVPALGLRSRRNPADVLAKLARAYVEDVAPDGSVATVLDQIRTVVDLLSTPERYDAVLVDARAGLHEASASAILGLGAEVFLFGRDEEQTFQGYAFLLAHLARLRAREGSTPVTSATPPDWLERLTPVQALAPVDAAARASFAQRWGAMTRETGLLPGSVAPTGVPLPDGFHDVPWADDEPEDSDLPDDFSLLQPLAILRSSEYDRFEPLNRQDVLSRSVYETVFRELIARVDTANGSPDGGPT